MQYCIVIPRSLQARAIWSRNAWPVELSLLKAGEYL